MTDSHAAVQDYFPKVLLAQAQELVGKIDREEPTLKSIIDNNDVGKVCDVELRNRRASQVRPNKLVLTRPSQCHKNSTQNHLAAGQNPLSVDLSDR